MQLDCYGIIAHRLEPPIKHGPCNCSGLHNRYIGLVRFPNSPTDVVAGPNQRHIAADAGMLYFGEPECEPQAYPAVHVILQ